MNVHLANALITGAPLSEADLALMIAHYSALEGLLRVSGPRFANARLQAVEMHNRSVRRLRGEREEARRRATLDAEDEPLLEIA